MVGARRGAVDHHRLELEPRAHRQRAVAGTLAACAVLATLHVVLAHGVARSKFFSMLVEGRPVELGRSGTVDHDERKRHMISESDLMEALRKNGIEDASDAGLIVLEASGEITVMKSGA